MREAHPIATINRELQPVAESGWRRGFANLLQNETHLRWGARRWLVPCLVWLAVLNGLILVVGIDQLNSDDVTIPEMAQECLDVFFRFGSLATAIGVVVGAQGLIIREKQLGTAAWILSKPASRSAFLLAKLIAHALTVVSLSLALPAVVFFGQMQLLFGQVPPLGPFLAAWGVMVLHALFYLAFTLMLGTMFNTRAPVTGIALGFLISGQVLSGFLPQWIVLVLPWPFVELAVALGEQMPLPAAWPIPIVATVLWIVLCVAVMLWRFGQDEF